MKRPWHVWTVFLLCLTVVLVGLGWISWTALGLDQSEAEARRQMALEENVRLALWRMDSALAPLLAEENARPHFVYSAFYSSELAQGREWNNDKSTVVPSPLFGPPPRHVAIYFQCDPRGQFTSPQIPAATKSARPDMPPVDPQTLEAAGKKLTDLRQMVDRDKLLALLPAPAPAVAALDVDPAHFNNGPVPQQPPAQQATFPAFPSQLENSSGQQVAGRNNGADLQQTESQQQAALPQSGAYDENQQRKRGNAEFQSRSQYLQNSVRVPQIGNNFNFGSANVFSAVEAVTGGVMQPLWIGEQLILARRVTIRGQSFIQGCWLDWPVMRQWLAAAVIDLLPAARLVRAAPADDDQGPRLLAALPAMLEPGDLPWEESTGLTPVQYALVIGWACAVLAAAAVAVLLFGVVSLSERRASFVSAVTHELRTPLTTFRMYAEMLAEGMVPDAEKRRKYLHTLRVEADRLMHLVENVLSYARLERGRARGHVETASLAELVERVKTRLAERAAQADMRFEAPAEFPAVSVKADISAVEQILFNLVDNACKYAVHGDERTIHLETGHEDGAAVVRVRDHGPGIAPAESQRLFQPFVKSARDAANSAPGIGLGLALSRRLARTMGGDLRVDARQRDGACFVLRLPAA